jgi:hypothetical protein
MGKWEGPNSWFARYVEYGRGRAEDWANNVREYEAGS